MKPRLNVHLYVTPICNLQCIHCYYEAKNKNFKIEKLLSIDEMKYIIISLIDNYNTYFDIEGGELFLREDINQLFSSLDKRYLERLTITTNGTVNFDYNQKYLKYLDELRVSFEGDTDILQQSIRKIDLRKPLYIARNLLKAGVIPTIRITLHKENFRFLKRMTNFFKKMGFKQFSFYEFQKSGRAFLDENYSLTQEEILTVLDDISTLDKNLSFKFSFPKSRINIIKQYTQYNISDISNIPSLTVNYNGELGICPWRIGRDIFTNFNKKTFVNDIDKMIENSLKHDCNHCSYVRIENA